MRSKTDVKTVRSGDAVSMILEGDKHTQPEPSEVRIVFPGGHVAVTRHSGGGYWAHISRNEQRHFDGDNGFQEGRITEARIDHEEGGKLRELPGEEITGQTCHVALRIEGRPYYPNRLGGWDGAS